MKTALWLKSFDLLLQLFALLLPFVLEPNAWQDISREFVLFYITVGAAQIISCFFNRILLPSHFRNPMRLFYELALVAFFFSIPFYGHTGYGNDHMVAVCVFTFGGAMAIWYGTISVLETIKIYQLVQVQNDNNSSDEEQ